MTPEPRDKDLENCVVVLLRPSVPLQAVVVACVTLRSRLHGYTMPLHPRNSRLDGQQVRLATRQSRRPNFTAMQVGDLKALQLSAQRPSIVSCFDIE